MNLEPTLENSSMNKQPKFLKIGSGDHENRKTKNSNQRLKGLTDMHRCHLMDAMKAGDNEYATTMNAAFKLFKRLEK